VLPDFTFAEETGCFEFVEALELLGRHLGLFFCQHLVHLAR
jgi:hypothetical protein